MHIAESATTDSCVSVATVIVFASALYMRYMHHVAYVKPICANI
jgi:hypothetical protein